MDESERRSNRCGYVNLHAPMSRAFQIPFKTVVRHSTTVQVTVQVAQGPTLRSEQATVQVTAQVPAQAAGEDSTRPGSGMSHAGARPESQPESRPELQPESAMKHVLRAKDAHQ